MVLGRCKYMYIGVNVLFTLFDSKVWPKFLPVLWVKELFCKSIQKSQNTYLKTQEQNITKRTILTINHCWNYL